MNHVPVVASLDGMLEAVKSLSGDYAECGVWRGEVAQYIAERMAADDSVLWLFDSFAGHPEPGPFDDAKAHPKGRYADTTIQMVEQRCPNAVIIPGFLPGTLKAVSDMQFRFVRVDVDHYQATKDVVEFFKPRMVPGGIMQFDDYNHEECPGATKAINEVIGAENVKQPAHWINA